MTHILLSLSEEATRQAWGTAETALHPHSLGRTA
jgi:hypothetical protein